MNKTIKIILLLAGIGLLAYGIYTLIQPETSLEIGDTSLFEAQDNTNAYIITGLGIVALGVALFGGKK